MDRRVRNTYGTDSAATLQNSLADPYSIHVLDLGGNVRKNPKLSGTKHNVFGIQVGVSINLFVRKRKKEPSAK